MGLPMEAWLVYDIPVVGTNIKTRKDLVRNAADLELVSLAQAGCLDSFEELVRRYRNDVFRLAYHYVRDREEAWDLSQEVFIKVYRSLGRFRGEANFKTWVLRISANQCKDYFKRRRLKTVAFDEHIGVETPCNVIEPGRAALAGEIGDAIQAALGKLSHKHRTAFVLREFEGLSYEEMSQVMQCSVGTVMSRLHHARKKLQQALIRMGIVEEPGS